MFLFCLVTGIAAMEFSPAAADSTPEGIWTQPLGDGPILFSPDGTHLASPDEENQLVIRSVPEGATVQTVDVPANEVAAAALAPGGTALALGHNETIQLWDVETGTLKVTLEGHEENVIALAYAGRGTRLASGDSGGEVRIWSQENKQTIRSLNYGGLPNVLVFHPNTPTIFEGLFVSGRVAFSPGSPVFAYASAPGQLGFASN